MKVLYKGILGLLTLFLIGLGVLQMPLAQGWLAKELSRLLSHRNPAFEEVRLQGLQGWIPFHMSCEHIDVADTKGVWLSLTHLNMDVNLISLLRGTLDFSELSAAHVHLKRRPQGESAPSSPPKFWIPFVRVHFKAPHILLEEALVGERLEIVIPKGDLEGSLSQPDLHLTSLVELKGKDFSLKALLKGAGTWENFSLEALSQVSHEKLKAYGFQTLEGIVKFPHLPQKMQAELLFKSLYEDQEMALKTQAFYEKDQVFLKDFEFNFLKISLKGDFSVDPLTGLAEGTLKAQIPDLLPLSSFLKVPLKGQGEGQVILSHSQAKQELKGQISLKNLRNDTFTLQKGELHFNLKDLKSFGVGKAEISLAQAHIGPLKVTQATGQIDFTKNQGTYRLSLKEKKGEMSLQGSLALDKNNQKVKIQNLQGRYLGKKFLLKQPVLVTVGPQNLDIPAVDLTYGKIRIQGKGGLKEQQVFFLLEAQADLETLAAVFFPLDDPLKGFLTLSLKGEGSLSNPILKGRLNLREGSYENLEYGTLLKRISLQAEFSSERILIQDFKAEDGHQGTFKGEGTYDLKSHTSQLKGRLQNFLLAHTDECQIQAQGDLSLRGPLSALNLSGLLKLSPVNIQLTERFSGEIPDLEVIEVEAGSAAPLRRTISQKASSPSFPLSFNLKMEAPHQVFVRGRGLDSEWKGNVDLKGSFQKPLLQGKFKLIRGHFNFIGKTIALREGSLSFTGKEDLMPYLNVKGFYKSPEIDIFILLSGTPHQPKLMLSSDPVLPQEEILSRFLFGKEKGRISLLQSLQLANAAAALQGKKNSSNLLGDLRASLGFDSLSVKESGEGLAGSTLAVGKYLTDKVHISLEQGLKAEETKILVETELTPQISLETEAGLASTGGVGLTYKWDY